MSFSWDLTFLSMHTHTNQSIKNDLLHLFMAVLHLEVQNTSIYINKVPLKTKACQDVPEKAVQYSKKKNEWDLENTIRNFMSTSSHSSSLLFIKKKCQREQSREYTLVKHLQLKNKMWEQNRNMLLLLVIHVSSVYAIHLVPPLFQGTWAERSKPNIKTVRHAQLYYEAWWQAMIIKTLSGPFLTTAHNFENQ